MPPYRGRAVDRLPRGQIQHLVFEVVTQTTRDGELLAEDDLNLTVRVETWNSRSRGRLTSTLVAGRFQADDGCQVAVGKTIDDVSLTGDVCQRWTPGVNVIRQRTCTGVNDRDTAVIEHNETGLEHNYRHRRLSPYDIRSLLIAGRRVVNFRWSSTLTGDCTVTGKRPAGAPILGSSRTTRTAQLLRLNFHLVRDETLQDLTVDGHHLQRRAVTRVLMRELIPDTPANRRPTAMTHPNARVQHAPASHEAPK